MRILNRTQKSYLRGAVWIGALPVVVLLPREGAGTGDDRNEGLFRNFKYVSWVGVQRALAPAVIPRFLLTAA
jgi:hypothetical protein